MKIVKVPYRKNIQVIIDSTILGLAITGAILMISSIVTSDWRLVSISSLIAIPSLMYTWKIMTSKIFIWTKDFIRVKIIADINSDGFTIITDQKTQRIEWSKVKKIELDKEENLLVGLNGKQRIKIDKDYYRWFHLLQNIPESKLRNSQIPDFLEDTARSLETCKVCGKIAVKEGTCLSCKSIIFSDELRVEFKNEEEYIKVEQLDWFCTDNKFDQVSFEGEEDDGFQTDKNWNPIVTEKEVIEYSRINIWD